MDQLYRKTCFEPIYIKQLTPPEKRRAKKNIMILDKNITTTKNQGNNGVQ